MLGFHHQSVMIFCGLAATLLMAGTASAQYETDFETFTVDQSVDGQDGWRATNPNWDEEITDVGGNLVWRLSNAVTAGSFSDQPFAPNTGLIAGESGAEHPFSGNPVVTDRFVASFDFWSATAAAQPDTNITISPVDGNLARQSFIRIEDNGATGIDLVFFDTDRNDPAVNPNGGFRPTVAATDLAYDQVYRLTFDITFIDDIIDHSDGSFSGNDIVRIYLDDALIHTGTSWESYWWTTTEGTMPPSLRAVDTLLFRVSGTANPSAAGGGFNIDNVFISNEPQIPETFPVPVLGTFGLVLMATVLMLFALIAMQLHRVD